MPILVWDFDNTLAYRNGMWVKTLYDLLQEHGHRISEEDIRPHLQHSFPWHRYQEHHSEYFLGRTWWEYINELITKAMENVGMDKQTAILLASLFRCKYLDIAQWSLFDDTIRNLERSVYMGCKNYILSNHTPELPELVEGLGIRKYFKRIISSADIGYEKPNILIYQSLLSYIREDSKIYMIGDSYEADVLGAIQAGFEAILVRKSDHPYKQCCLQLDEVWKFI